MIAIHSKLRALLLLATASVVLGFSSVSYAELSGSYLAILNENNTNNPQNVTTPGNNFSDSKRSVVFFDAQKLNEGPLFAVMVPFENGTTSLWEEPQALAVNPKTGDIYIFAFDSSGASPADQWSVDQHATPDDESDDDTNGDLDIFRINFSTVVNHWKTNFMGQDVKTLGGALAVGNTSSVSFTMPMQTGDVTAAHAQDYVTYGVLSPFGEDAQLVANHNSPAPGVFDEDHPNTFQLGNMTTAGGAIEKIGEISRNRYLGTSSFMPQILSFIDENTLFMIDDARQSRSNPHDVNNDIDFRMVERVSTSPGAATEPASPSGIDGGFNRTTTESWESRRIAQMLLDTDQPTSTLSEAQSAAYQSAGSVRGVWVVDRDQTAVSCTGCGANFLDADGGDNGDDLAFLQLDSNNNSLGYRQFVGGATKFQMSNDPGAVTPDGLGHIGKVFVDSDTGDLIVVEEGFMDSSPSEPAVIRASVNFNGGSGSQIALTWGSRIVLNPGDKDPSDTTASSPTSSTPYERGYFSAYDSVTDTIYFAAPGSLETTAAINNMLDIYALDLTTGMTTAYLNVDDRYFPFFATNPEARDSLVAFTIVPGLPGDYNEDGSVDAADYTVWRNNLGGAADAFPNRDPGNAANPINGNDYTFWKNNYAPAGSGGGGLAGDLAVPEPSSLALLLVGLAGCAVRRRK